MRTATLMLCSMLLLVLAGAATGKASTVTITKNGYVPSSLTIATGDTVQFTNSDSVAHQVEFKSTTGVTCAPNPLVVQPAASGSCVFTQAGSYSYSDPNVHGNTYRGSVTVAAPPDAVTMAASPLLLVFGAKVTGSGTVSTQKAGESVDVLAQQCGASSATKAATVQTTTGGAYTYSSQPLANTTYTTKLRNATSPPATVRVRPRLVLARVAAHRYTLRAYAADSLAGKYAGIQRYNGTTHRWVSVKLVALKAGTGATAPAVLATASFRSAVSSGLRLRAALAQAQVGSCYAPGLSNTIRS
jgi:plastocyanin